MRVDAKSFLRSSNYVLLKICEKVIVLIAFYCLNYISTTFDYLKLFSGQFIYGNMESNQSKTIEQIIRCQKKEDLKIKSQIVANAKNKKVNSFKSSLEKLFRIKSKNEKSNNYDDLKVGIIPQTIYLTPQQTVSLSRDLEKIQKILPISKQSVRHSCSDSVYRQSSTFCGPVNAKTNKIKNMDRVTSPHRKAFCSVTENECKTIKEVSLSNSSIPHSKSTPVHLSKSHHNITQCNQDDLTNIKPAKRTVRRKGLFKCSLFRKRSNSHSKSAEKVNEKSISKSLNRTDIKNPSTLSDRCLTLPNLKSSEMDLTQDSNGYLPFSMDLIKDYMNRSNSSLQLSVQANSIDSSLANPYQSFSTPVHNDPVPPSMSGSDQKKLKTLQAGLSASMFADNRDLVESIYSQKSASNEMSQSRCSRETSPLIALSNAYKYPNVISTSDEHHKPPLQKQISAPVYYQSTHLSSMPTNSAFEFWTRPYQEKLKASRRRLLDDKVGSKEALLRSLSPHNLKIGDPIAIYDNPYQLHIIPEPMVLSSIDSNSCEPVAKCLLSHSKSFYNSIQYRMTNHENIQHDYRHHSSTSPIIENRLLESPIAIPRRQMGGNNLIYSEVRQKETSKPTLADISMSQKERNQPCSDKISPLRRNHFEGSLPEIKDNKSINSSTELILTRTPTPPHSFAESPVSSIYPVPTEFISEITKSQSHPYRLYGNANLLYASDNSEDETDQFSPSLIEQIPPIPPPRTDSVVRSLQAQQVAFDYDISDDFPPVFSGSNIERCDIEQYHKWLEKLPYKITEFPNLLQYKKSASSLSKESALTETLNYGPKKVDLFVKQFKQPRKSIKSWNTSENSRLTRNELTLDSNSLKKSHSYDQCLNNLELQCIRETSPTTELNLNNATIEGTLLKQYSHLYSLKPSPSQANVFKEISPTDKNFKRSKSIDLRNFANNISSTSLSEKSSEMFAQHRKSVPNAKLTFVEDINEISGNSKHDSVESEFKVYPML